jgi:hypothetical protein
MMMKAWIRLSSATKLRTGLLSLAMSLVLALSLVPLSAMANPGTVGDTSAALTLSTATANIPAGKIKVDGDMEGSDYWATAGQAEEEGVPATGTAFEDLDAAYAYHLNANGLVPAQADETISVVEVNADGDVIGYAALAVTAANIGSVAPLVDLGYESPIIAVNNYLWINANELYENGQSYITFSNIHSSDPDVLQSSYSYGNQFYLYASALGTSTISFDVTDNRTGEETSKSILVTVALQAPYLDEENEYPFTGLAFGLTFNSNADWVNAIDAVTVNGTVLAADDYSITNENTSEDNGDTYTYGEILFHPGVLGAGGNEIIVKADGYSNSELYVDVHASEQSFYMSEPAIDKTNGGLGASVNVVRSVDNDAYWSQSSVVFQLMKGNVPVSTVSFTIEELDDYQSFQAHFNLQDAVSNPNYSVRAFIVTGNNADLNNLGYSVASTVNAEEFQAKYDAWRHWD